MKAAVIHAFGQPPRYEDFPEPTAADGEVRVTVRAAGLHPVVKAMASGAHYASANVLPLIPGVDAVQQYARHLARTALTALAHMAPEHEPVAVRTALSLVHVGSAQQVEVPLQKRHAEGEKKQDLTRTSIES